MTNFTLHLTFNSISCPGKEEIYLLAYGVGRSRTIGYGEERRRGFPLFSRYSNYPT